MILARRALVLLAAALALAPPLARAAPPPPVRIAFVDTGNTGRSLMAETLARDLAARSGLDLRFISRGLEVDPWDEAPEANAATLMAERGLSVAGHVARPLEARDIAGADLILVMTPTHREKVLGRAPEAAARVFLLSEWATGRAEPIPDAWGRPMAAYRAVLDQLDLFLPPALERAAKLTPARR
jgi:protein-tyrosine phosphatase